MNILYEFWTTIRIRQQICIICSDCNNKVKWTECTFRIFNIINSFINDIADSFQLKKLLKLPALSTDIHQSDKYILHLYLGCFAFEHYQQIFAVIRGFYYKFDYLCDQVRVSSDCQDDRWDEMLFYDLVFMGEGI